MPVETRRRSFGGMCTVSVHVMSYPAAPDVAREGIVAFAQRRCTASSIGTNVLYSNVPNTDRRTNEKGNHAPTDPSSSSTHGVIVVLFNIIA